MGPAASKPLHSRPEGHLLRPPRLPLPGRQCCVVRSRGRHRLQVGACGGPRDFLSGPSRPLQPSPSPGLSPLLPHSAGPVSGLIPLSADTVAVGLVSSVVVYPVYLVILFLFRMSRSKVGWGPRSSRGVERGPGCCRRGRPAGRAATAGQGDGEMQSVQTTSEPRGPRLPCHRNQGARGAGPMTAAGQPVG